MKEDWRAPFLKLKAGLRSLYDANLRIHHAVLLSTNRSEKELQPIFAMLEPAYICKNIAKSIVVNTDGCVYHSHLFFADDCRGLDQLGRWLKDIEEWVARVPRSIVPVAFDIPIVHNQAHRNIVRWVSLVYYLAWISDAPYLDAELEYQESANRSSFLPWSEWPQPPGCHPYMWLIHQGSSKGRISEWQNKFELRGESLPDVMDAYLTGDLIACSLAAIDVLAFVLNGEKREKSVETEDYAERLKSKRPKTQKVAREVKRLEVFLAGWHNSRRVELAKMQARSSQSNESEDPYKPLTAVQIAEQLNWITPVGHFAQSKVNNRMEVIFGPNPMEKYKDALTSSDGGSRFRDLMKDGTHTGERFIESKTATRLPTSKLPEDDDD